jgi:hypothetical protein
MLENRGIEIKKLENTFSASLMVDGEMGIPIVRCPCLFVFWLHDRIARRRMRLATVYPGMHYLRAGNMEGGIALVTVKESKAPRNPLRWISIYRGAILAAIRPLNPIGRRTL